MTDVIFGELRTSDGHSVVAGLTIADNGLRLATKTEEIGSWPIDRVRLEPVDSHTIRLTLAGESADFVVDDPRTAAAVLELRRVGSTSLWVAAQPGVWERAEGHTRNRPRLSRLHVAPLVAALATAAIAVFGFSLMQSPVEAESSAPAVVSQATAVSTTIALPDGVPEIIAPLGTPLIDAVRAWNALAADYDTGLTVEEGARSAEWGGISIEFSTTEFGMLSSVLLTAEPGPAGSAHAEIVVAMGQVIGTVDPSLEGPQRRAVLARMGFDVGEESLVGLDGTTAMNGVDYHLWYDPTAPAVNLRATVSGD